MEYMYRLIDLTTVNEISVQMLVRWCTCLKSISPSWSHVQFQFDRSSRHIFNQCYSSAWIWKHEFSQEGGSIIVYLDCIKVNQYIPTCYTFQNYKRNVKPFQSVYFHFAQFTRSVNIIRRQTFPAKVTCDIPGNKEQQSCTSAQ